MQGEQDQIKDEGGVALKLHHEIGKKFFLRILLLSDWKVKSRISKKGY